LRLPKLLHKFSIPDTGEFQIDDQFVAKKGGAARLNDILHEISKLEKQ
jgi:hypothetical protein